MALTSVALLGRTSFSGFEKSSVQARRVQLPGPMDDDVVFADEFARVRSDPCCGEPASPCSTMAPSRRSSFSTSTESCAQSRRSTRTLSRRSSFSSEASSWETSRLQLPSGGNAPSSWWTSDGSASWWTFNGPAEDDIESVAGQSESSFRRVRTDSGHGMPECPYTDVQSEDDIDSDADETENHDVRRLSFTRVRTDSCFGMPVASHTTASREMSLAMFSAMLQLNANSSSFGNPAPRPTCVSTDGSTQDDVHFADNKTVGQDIQRHAASQGNEACPRPLQLKLSGLLGDDVESADNAVPAKSAEEDHRPSMPPSPASMTCSPAMLSPSMLPAMSPALPEAMLAMFSPAMHPTMLPAMYPAMLPGCPVYSQQANVVRGVGANARWNDQPQKEQPTTICFRNIPNNYSTKMVMELLNSNGLSGHYDFVYVPHDFKRLPQLVNVGYFFVNFLSHDVAASALEMLAGFKKWKVLSSKVLTGTWAAKTQGRAACVERCKYFSFMHEEIPSECKPMMFENGVAVAEPSKSIPSGPRCQRHN